MASGVYALIFSSGDTYIGKAIDIAARWQQHIDKMLAGKAANKVQTAYNKYGMPEFKVLYYVHSDHIDLVESILINMNKDSMGLLNTASGLEISQADHLVLAEYVRLLEHSTADHIRLIIAEKERIKQAELDNDKLQRQLEELFAKYDKILNKGIKLPSEWSEEHYEIKARLEKLEEYTEMYSKLNWFDRMITPFRP